MKKMFKVIQTNSHEITLLDKRGQEIATLRVPAYADVNEVSNFENDIEKAYIKLQKTITERIVDQD